MGMLWLEVRCVMRFPLALLLFGVAIASDAAANELELAPAPSRSFSIVVIPDTQQYKTDDVQADIRSEPDTDPVAIAIGYYRVHAASHTQAIIGAIFGSLAAMRGIWCERSKQAKKGQGEEP